MPEFDLLIRGASPHPAIGIADGKVVAFAEGEARETVDADGLLVVPGLVDAHVHFNDPGRAEWEGWDTGSRGAVAGGVTTACDMPLNSTPPVVTVEAFDAKRAAAEAKSLCDFALWGGLVPGHLDDLEPLAARGVIGFKAFMIHSGIEDFPCADLGTLRAGMKRATSLGLPVGVHAEIESRESEDDRGLRGFARISDSPSASIRAIRGSIPSGSRTVRDYLASRPVEMETDAIRAALEIAGETGCALHVVHVSTARGLELIAEARAQGVKVTAETCPHYLVFTDEDMERIGAAAKCAPPMRDEANRLALWQHLRAGHLDTIGSDHSPSPWALKTDVDFFKVWGGISGVQHLLPVLLDAGLEAPLLARLAAENPARRFRLRGKGRLEIGADADLVLVELGDAHEITAESLFYRHRHSPYVGRRIRARVRRTILRGRTVFLDGKTTASAGGQLLTPA